jgi:hypothetical protein
MNLLQKIKNKSKVLHIGFVVVSYLVTVIIFLMLMKLNWIAVIAFIIGLMLGQIGEKLKWWDN